MQRLHRRLCCNAVPRLSSARDYTTFVALHTSNVIVFDAGHEASSHGRRGSAQSLPGRQHVLADDGPARSGSKHRRLRQRGSGCLGAALHPRTTADVTSGAAYAAFASGPHDKPG